MFHVGSSAFLQVACSRTGGDGAIAAHDVRVTTAWLDLAGSAEMPRQDADVDVIAVQDNPAHNFRVCGEVHSQVSRPVSVLCNTVPVKRGRFEG